MKHSVFILLFIQIVFPQFIQSQPSDYLQGFGNEAGGKRFGYHSPFPEVNSSLLVRGRADYKPVSWYTDTVPADFTDPFVAFIWLYGMDVSSNPAVFHLKVNNRQLFTFSSAKISETGIFNLSGEDGSLLTFNVTMLDKYEDQMGFAILKVPSHCIVPGTPALIEVSADHQENDAWYMTFTTQVHEKVVVYQNKVVAKYRDDLYHSVSIDFIHIGDPADATVFIGDSSAHILLKAGYNKLEMLVPRVFDTTWNEVTIRINDSSPVVRSCPMYPVRPWEIFLIQHTHTDIGYTRPQSEILPEHLRYIDDALVYCEMTDNYPDDAKFRWTCENSWSVREYLTSRPTSKTEQLLNRIQEGRIEVTGMFLNFSEIADEASLAEQTKTLRMLRNSGIEVTTAMQNDVNGIAWCLIDQFENTGVKYLTMGIHAHRAQKPFYKPTAFWWESPSGNRLLAYRSEHYQHGNALSLTTGQQDVFRSNLSQYLSWLEAQGYPYNKTAIQFSGYLTDNSPPSVKVCDIIRTWNEKYEWPKLRSSLASEFMIFLNESHAGELSVKKVAWPDWWTDGVASAANETKIVRQTQARVSAITALLSLSRCLGADWPKGIRRDIEDIYDNLLFYDEHTHGAAESISDPLAQNTVNQWGMKSAYAWEAYKKTHALEEKVFANLEPHLGTSDKPRIVVVNTLNWKRSGLVEVFIRNSVIPDGADFIITDQEGNEVSWHKYDQRMEGAYYGLWVENIPAMGFKTLLIHNGVKGREIAGENELYTENRYYRLTIDATRGLITGIFDKELGYELLDRNDTLTFGSMIYEQLSNRHDLERLTHTTRDTVYRPLDLVRSALQNIIIKEISKGSIYNSIHLHGDLPICADERGVDIEIRLFHPVKKIELHYRMFKLPVETPESVYIAFPFSLPESRLAFEVPGGVVYPGVNQLEGSSSDWNTIQSFASARNQTSQIVFSSPEIPLVQFGDINTGHYYYRLQPKSSHIFSWVLNNYWVTNFKASQQGELRWSYRISSANDPSDQYSTQFGWGEIMPLLSRIIMPASSVASSLSQPRTIVDLEFPNLLLVQATPALGGDAVILHFREISGGHADVNLQALLADTGASSATEVNILEENISNLSDQVVFNPYQTKFIRLDFE